MRAVRLNSTLELGTLAANDAIAIALVATSDSEYRMRSVKLTWLYSNIPNLDGGVMVGLAAPGLTAAQIEEYLEATNSIDRLNILANEQAGRKVRVIGSFGSGPGNTSSADEEYLNGGRPITTKLNWFVPIGGQVTMWAYNQSTGNLTDLGEIVALGSTNIEYQ